MKPINKEVLELKIEIKSYDIDIAGHVNNIVYVRWLEDLRVNLFGKISPIENLMEKGLFPVVTKSTITYKKPLKFSDTVIGRVWIEFVKHGIIFIKYEFESENQIISSAEQNCVLMNLKTGIMDKKAAGLFIHL